MTRRWVWTAFDLLALICLGQACLLAQRQAQALDGPSALDAVSLAPAEQDYGRLGTRIYQTPQSVVVALKVANPSDNGMGVSVDRGNIRLSSPASQRLEEIPLPNGADPGRFTVRRVAGEVRIVFARAAEGGS